MFEDFQVDSNLQYASQIKVSLTGFPLSFRVSRRPYPLQTSNMALVDSLEKQIMHSVRQRREHTKEAQHMCMFFFFFVLKMPYRHNISISMF